MPDHAINPDDPLPRYYQVYNSLLGRIREGEFSAGEALPPERRLTKAYGVSRITIVKALDLLERDGFIERQHGRGTFVTDPVEAPSDGTYSIAFLPGVFDHPYLFSVLTGIAHRATQHDFHLHVMGAYRNSDEETYYINEAIDRGIDGLIVYPRPGYANIDLYRRLQEQDFPLVMVDRYYPQVLTDRVIFDDETAGYELTTLLLERGHRRIAVVPHHEVEVTTVRARLNGYRRALEAANIPFDEELIWLDVYATFDPTRTQAADGTPFVHRLRRRLEDCSPTALLAINRDSADRLVYDLMSIRTDRMRAVIEGGGDADGADYELDVDVATFSHTARTDYRIRPLAMAVHSGEHLGEQAVDLLNDRVKGKVTAPAQAMVVPMEIVSSS